MMKTKRFCKSTVSLLLVFMMLVSMLTVGIVSTSAAETDVAETGNNITGGMTFYLKPGAFGLGGDRFAAYLCNGTSSAHWYSASDNDGDGVYSITVDAGETHANIIWCRMDGNNATNSWSNPDTVWGQTDDLTYDGTKNCYEITSHKSGEYYNGQWSVYTPTVVNTTKSVTLGIAEDIDVSKVTFAWWGTGTPDTAEETITATGEIKSYTVDDVTKNYIIYSADVPTGGNSIATNYTWKYDGTVLSDGPSVSNSDGQILLLTGTNTQTRVDINSANTGGDDTDDTKVYFVDDTDTTWIADEDADVYAVFGSTEVKMKHSIDTVTGKTMWYADIPSGASTVTFSRRPKVSGAWSNNTWADKSLSGTSHVFYATSDGNGDWSTDDFAAPSETDITQAWYGIWVDTRGEGNCYDVVKMIKNSKDSTSYHVYLPSHTPDSFNLYTSFPDGACINATSGADIDLSYGVANEVNISDITLDTKYSLEKNTGNSSVQNIGSIYFHKSANTSALMLVTEDQFYTGTVGYTASEYKEDIKTEKGQIYLYNVDGSLVNDGEKQTDLKSIKGRGNSSFKASCEVYGKYAYNFNLSKAATLIDGATASKKWCLLANNVDHAMMRNKFVYNIANDLGLMYSPKTRLVDAYDNGFYLGSYIITEKVEYGGEDTLMGDLENLDDANEEANDGVDIETLPAQPGSLNIDGVTYQYQYRNFTSPENYNQYNFVLEHELHDRYTNEASWFYSSRTKQYVVVKYPEFANQQEMEWIIRQYEAMEKAVYEDDYDTYSGLIDVDSFAKMYLIQELSLNLDSCATSYYIHNEFMDADKTDSRLVAGPVWDYDWAFGAYAGTESEKLKPIYDENSKTTVSNTKSMANPYQMFVKNKAIKSDNDESADKYVSNYNLQAKLAQNDSFWLDCQRIWTSQMVGILDDYIVNDEYNGDTSGTMVDQWLGEFESSVEMNHVRWSGSYNADDWGTKKTSDYDYGSDSFDYDNRAGSGSETDAYANTVYYLNDWIAERWNFMSTQTTDETKGGNLFNEDFVEKYEFIDIDYDYVQDENDKSQLTIYPKGTVNYEGQPLETDKLGWRIYVDGSEVTDDYIPMTQTSHTITLTEQESSVYISIEVLDNPEKIEYSSSYIFYLDPPEYSISNVSFTYDIDPDDPSMHIIKPSATVTYGSRTLEPYEYWFRVYKGNDVFDEDIDCSNVCYVPLDLGDNIIKVEVYIPEFPDIKSSATQTITYEIELDEYVDVTIYFKSSSSYRYLPFVSVNGEAATSMDQIGDDENGYIGHNSTRTQYYFWYSVTETVPTSEDLVLTFTNKNGMDATITLKAKSFIDGDYYFAVDNMNGGTKVDNLTKYNTGDVNDQAILNFSQSAAHMVQSDPTASVSAMTAIGGTVYKLGDADGSKSVNIMDVTALQMALARKSELTDTGLALADYNLDSTNSIADATDIQIYLAH